TSHRDAHLAAIPRRVFLGQAQPAQLRRDLHGGRFADVAGVEEDELGVVDGHLAAVRLDVQLARRRHGVLTCSWGALRLAAPRYRAKMPKIQRVTVIPGGLVSAERTGIRRFGAQLPAALARFAPGAGNCRLSSQSKITRSIAR